MTVPMLAEAAPADDDRWPRGNEFGHRPAAGRMLSRVRLALFASPGELNANVGHPQCRAR
jgi:hypothetical protein